MSEEIPLKSMMRDARENPAAQQTLTEEQQSSLLRMVTKRCSQETKRAIAHNIARPLTDWPGRWAIERIYFIGEMATYCAGQDYNWDMVQLRKQLIEFR